MSIQPIEANMNTRKHSSYFNAACVGVLGGIVAKYALPVSNQEYDSFVSQAFKKSHKKFTKENLSVLAKSARSGFDFAVVTALAFVSLAFLKNIYNKLADK